MALSAGKPEVVVVGSGPNGLAAAVRMAQAGFSVVVREAAETPGGGTRSEELTLPGFVHDVCSAAHPLGAASPYFRTLPLEQHGLRWIEPPAALAHPFDDGTAALLYRSVERTADGLGVDARAYRRLMEPLARHWEDLLAEILTPIAHVPRHPLLLARFGLNALLPATTLARKHFRGERAQAMFAGIASHANTPLNWSGTGALALVLGLAGHAVGWPIAEGGSRSVARALISLLRSLGGDVITGAPVHDLRELEGARFVFLDVVPRTLLRLAGDRLRGSYRRRLERFRHGPGVYKMDWALSGPVPWTAPECAQAATIHLGGKLEEMKESERSPEELGRAPRVPYVLLTQPTLFDPTRAPAGKHTLWAYCHVPNGSDEDMSERIEAQIERFAPGFRSRILARSILRTSDLERHNANLVGGDIAGGRSDLKQILFRPRLFPSPYRTPLPGVYLCSSSTPPGAGVHGMCGYNAAQKVVTTFSL